MKDDELRELLRGLPREAASDGFTQRVVTRAGESRRSFARPWAGRWVLAATAAVLGAVILPLSVQRWQQYREHEEARQRVESLRSEYQALEQELQELIRLTAESQPIIPLGEDEKFDFVLDLRDLARAQTSAQSRPVVYRPEGRR